jgi:hypothetical protein
MAEKAAAIEVAAQKLSQLSTRRILHPSPSVISILKLQLSLFFFSQAQLAKLGRLLQSKLRCVIKLMLYAVLTLLYFCVASLGFRSGSRHFCRLC